MRFTLSLLAAVVLALEVTAQDFQAFSGNDCDGTPGLVVACDGTCFDFTGEHSFVISNGNAADVVFFEGADCTGESFNFGPEVAGECINVNTGTEIQSFFCT
ncbi:hypothetical protein B0H11DRAFT_2272359 [Mycena galericulata]|nr:hypothetical protein B0H11DRAFT_1797758 [Mycena galericulata]KAJ7506148.1 hypothetical protein B0H11DRAFT_2272359 [Mycena galericulata]